MEDVQAKVVTAYASISEPVISRSFGDAMAVLHWPARFNRDVNSLESPRSAVPPFGKVFVPFDSPHYSD